MSDPNKNFRNNPKKPALDKSKDDEESDSNQISSSSLAPQVRPFIPPPQVILPPGPFIDKVGDDAAKK